METFAATVPPWMTQIRSLPSGCSGAKSDGLFDGVSLAYAVYGDVPGAQFAAFTYCWRRFGPPWRGSDPLKELAQYIFGTPHPAIFLTVGLSASPLPYAIGYLCTTTWLTEFGAPRRAWNAKFEAWWTTTKATATDRALLAHAHETGLTLGSSSALKMLAAQFWDARMDTTIVAEAEAILGPIPKHYTEQGKATVEVAVTATLIELLRPVFIRDVAINILGRVADDALDDRESASPSSYAGYGIPHAAMDALTKGDGGHASALE